MILGYSNDKSIYCEEYYFDWLVDSLGKVWHVQPTGFDPYHHTVPSEKFKGTKYLKLTLKHGKLQWHKLSRVISCYGYDKIITKLDKYRKISI